MENRSGNQRQFGKGRVEPKVVFLASIAIALVLTLAPTARGADTYGVGGGWVGPRLLHFAFSAHEGPDGDYGQAVVRTDDGLPPLEVTADIDCVNVVGQGAIFTGVVTKVSPEPNVFGVFLGEEVGADVFDGGQPSDGIVDTFVVFNAAVPPPPACKSFIPFSSPDVTQGNVNVEP
jgi:hypothetical protein